MISTRPSNTLPQTSILHAQLIRCIDNAKRHCLYQQYRELRASLSDAVKTWLHIGEFYRYSPTVIDRYPYPRSLIENIERLYQAVIVQDWYNAGLLLLHVERRVDAL